MPVTIDASLLLALSAVVSSLATLVWSFRRAK